MNTRQLNSKTALYISLFLVLAFWIITKLHLYQSLEYVSDMFALKDMALSLIDGRPLGHSYAEPNTFSVHNNYTIFLFTLFCKIFGAFGLILGLFLAWSSAALVTFTTLKRTSKIAVPFVFLGILGPVSFWVFDHPAYGFHLELLYFPLSLFLGIGLITQNNWLVFGSAYLICLNKEDGPILACTIFLSHLLASVPYRHWLKTNTVIKASKIILFWIVILILEMSILKLIHYHHEAIRGFDKNSDLLGHSRTDFYLNNFNFLLRKLEGRQYFAKQFFEMLALSLPVLFITRLKTSIKALGSFLILVWPIVLVTWLSSSHSRFSYLEWLGGPNMPSRFVMPWALTLCTLLFCEHFDGKNKKLDLPEETLSKKNYYIFPAVLAIQLLALLSIREYNLPKRAYLALFSDQKLEAGKFTIEEKAALKCISKKIPNWKTGYSQIGTQAWFDHQYTISWGLPIPEIEFNEPEFGVCADQSVGLNYYGPCENRYVASQLEHLKWKPYRKYRISAWTNPQSQLDFSDCLPQVSINKP